MNNFFGKQRIVSWGELNFDWTAVISWHLEVKSRLIYCMRVSKIKSSDYIPKKQVLEQLELMEPSGIINEAVAIRISHVESLTNNW